MILAAILGVLFAPRANSQSTETAAALPAPGFHHLHLNSINPDAAIDFYMKQFPSTTKTTVAGFPALKAGKVYVLFTKVSTPPPTEPQTAIWHFGWHVVDVRKNLAMYKERKEVKLLPLYTSDEGGSVLVSSDTYPGTGGILGLTKSQIAEAKAAGVKPLGRSGLRIPARTRRRHHRVPGKHARRALQSRAHVSGRSVLRATLVSETPQRDRAAGGAPGAVQHTEADCKVERSEPSWPGLEKEGTIRKPSAGVLFDDVALMWYERQGDQPLVSTRGHLADHVGLSVNNLDAWIAKLQSEGVKFLQTALQIWGHPRRDDRRPQPRSAGTDRNKIICSAGFFPLPDYEGQPAENMIGFVILSEAKNLSSI